MVWSVPDSETGPEGRRPGLRLAHGLREAWVAGYGWSQLCGDLRAGLVVALVAVPLSMALAIATGLPPVAGLISAALGGAIAALFSGSRVQVTGPTAAFVIVLAPIVHTHGIGGLFVASLLGGAMLIGMGFARLGRLIQYVPYPVTIGLTAGIGLVIATLQVNDLLWLGLDVPPDFFRKVALIGEHIGDTRLNELGLGLGTLAILVGWPRVFPRIPAPLAALVLATLAGYALEVWLPEHAVATVASRFEGGLRSGLPVFELPWAWPGPQGAELVFDRNTILALLRGGFAVAVLGALASLLSAVVADGMAGFRHDPDGELVAQGLANTVLPFFGGVAGAGAIARTATNVRYGARSPIAALAHAGFVFAALMLFSPLLNRLPMAALAALLLTVAWNMSEVRHLPRILRQGPRSDAIVLAAVFGATVVFDMATGVAIGLVLASMLFMRRMIEVSGVRLLGAGHPEETVDVPPGVLHYEVTGPLFFGAVHKATGLLERAGHQGAVVLLDLRAVPAIDGTALVNLRGAIERCLQRGTRVVIAGLQPQPVRALERGGLTPIEGRLGIESRFDAGLACARAWSTAGV